MPVPPDMPRTNNVPQQRTVGAYIVPVDGSNFTPCCWTPCISPLPRSPMPRSLPVARWGYYCRLYNSACLWINNKGPTIVLLRHIADIGTSNKQWGDGKNPTDDPDVCSGNVIRDNTITTEVPCLANSSYLYFSKFSIAVFSLGVHKSAFHRPAKCILSCELDSVCGGRSFAL